MAVRLPYPPYTVMSNEAQLAEAREAVAVAVARYPFLTADGVNNPEPLRHKLDYDLAFMQVATAIAFLRRCTPTVRTKLSSYGLKHDAERWGATQPGLSPYVSNGALIAAAVYLGFPTRPYNYKNQVGRIVKTPSALVGVKVPR